MNDTHAVIKMFFFAASPFQQGGCDITYTQKPVLSEFVFEVRGGRSGGAMVLGNLDYSMARAYCACSRCGWGLFGYFFVSRLSVLSFVPLFGGRPDLD